MFINKYIATFHYGLPTLAVPYNKLFPILVAFDFKGLQIICNPRRMKCFQTIFSNTYFVPTTTDVSLRLGLMFTCRKNILFYVEFSSLPFSF